MKNRVRLGSLRPYDRFSAQFACRSSFDYNNPCGSDRACNVAEILIQSTRGGDMEFHPQYWHWLVFGMILIIVELIVPSFTVFWFGLAGLIVGAVLLVAPRTSFTWQLFLWALASGFMTYLWFKLFKPLMADRTKAGISREALIGEGGQVIKAPAQDQRGMLRFTTPVLGSEEWPFICEQAVAVGDRVVVTDISGNTLIVTRR
jgi:membrane protein implicated in regulation of membrane protease activity